MFEGIPRSSKWFQERFRRSHEIQTASGDFQRYQGLSGFQKCIRGSQEISGGLRRIQVGVRRGLGKFQLVSYGFRGFQRCCKGSHGRF